MMESCGTRALGFVLELEIAAHKWSDEAEYAKKLVNAKSENA
jgi:hypothetical protein